MTVKPIAAGMPQRIIEKINELVNAVNTGGSGGSGTADAILDAATVADAGKALGIDAEGDPALINIEGTEPIICQITYTGSGTPENPYVGHINNAAKLLNALNAATSYNPVVGFTYDKDGVTQPSTPAIVVRKTGEYEGTPFTQSSLTVFAAVTGANLSRALQIVTAKLGDTDHNMVIDEIRHISAQTWTVADDVLSYSEQTE